MAQDPRDGVTGFERLKAKGVGKPALP